MFPLSAPRRRTATSFWFLCISIRKTSIFKPNVHAKNKTQIINKKAKRNETKQKKSNANTEQQQRPTSRCGQPVV